MDGVFSVKSTILACSGRLFYGLWQRLAKVGLQTMESIQACSGPGVVFYGFRTRPRFTTSLEPILASLV